MMTQYILIHYNFDALQSKVKLSLVFIMFTTRCNIFLLKISLFFIHTCTYFWIKVRCPLTQKGTNVSTWKHLSSKPYDHFMFKVLVLVLEIKCNFNLIVILKLSPLLYSIPKPDPK